MQGIQYILTDIEGTTTSIDFVHAELFPYAYERLPAYVRAHAHEETVKACLLQTQQTLLEEGKNAEGVEVLIAALLDWIKTDRKHPALKTLQGLLWQEGYETGAFQGHVYPDVLPRLLEWRAQGIGLGIYSSGSVAAQRLLFGYSVFGDLNGLFDHNFDTAVGHKKEPAAYQHILQVLGLPAESVLFLSDVEAELDAAQEAGIKTIQLVREGTVASERHLGVTEFGEIKLA
jgi:enolase-phosphatase E1